MTLISIYITFPNEKVAKKIISKLIENKMIACANLFPTNSIYKWKNKIVDENEIAGILKTKRTMWSKVKKELIKQHPYDIPCIEKIDTTANLKYENWVFENVE